MMQSKKYRNESFTQNSFVSEKQSGYIYIYITETFSRYPYIIYSSMYFECFYIDIIYNSLFCSIFRCPFETDIAFEGGNKYLRFKHKINRWMDGWMTCDFTSFSTVF